MRGGGGVRQLKPGEGAGRREEGEGEREGGRGGVLISRMVAVVWPFRTEHVGFSPTTADIGRGAGRTTEKACREEQCRGNDKTTKSKDISRPRLSTAQMIY